MQAATKARSRENWKKRDPNSLEVKVADVIKKAINGGSTMMCGKGDGDLPELKQGMLEEIKTILFNVSDDIREPKNAEYQEAFNKVCLRFHEGCEIPITCRAQSIDRTPTTQSNRKHQSTKLLIDRSTIVS